MERNISKKNNNTPQISIGMKRFFTKSKVALLLVISIAVFSFSKTFAASTNFGTSGQVPTDSSINNNPSGVTTNNTSTNLQTTNSDGTTGLTQTGTYTTIEKIPMILTAAETDRIKELGSKDSLTAAESSELLQLQGKLYTDLQNKIKNGDTLTQAQTDFMANYTAGAANVTNGASTNTYDLFKNIGKSMGDLGAGILFKGPIAALQISLYVIQLILAAILYVAGALLDFAINFSTNGLTDLFSSTSQLMQIWTLIRDMFNVSFIFIMLYIAITKILGSVGVKSKTTIVSVVLSAVFINFSIFITKFLIDISNILAIALYNIAIPAGSSLSSELMNVLQLKDSIGIISTLTLTGQTNMIIMLVVQNTLLAVAIWAFFYVALMFIGRAVMLIVLVVTSPLGFIRGSIPLLADKGNDWWKSLTGQIMMAPIFMLFLDIIMKIIKMIPEIKVPGSSNFNITAYFIYIFVIVFILRAVKETKKYSGEVGEMTGKLATFVTGAAMAAATGGTALIARQTLGRGAAALKNTALGARLESATKSQNIFTAGAAKLAQGGINRTATGTMDVRNTGVAKEILDMVKSEGGIDLTGGRKAGGTYGKGKDAKGGFEGWQAQQRKTVEDEAKAMSKASQDFEGNIKKEIENMEAVQANLKQKAEDPNTSAENKKQYEQQIATLEKQINQKKAGSPDAMKKKAEEIVDRSPEAIERQERIANREKEKAELERKLAEVKQRNEATNITAEQKRKNFEDMANYLSELNTITEDINQQNKQHNSLREAAIEAETSNENGELAKTNKVFQAIITRRNIRKKFAEQLRTRIVSSPNKIFTLGGILGEKMGGREDVNLSGIALGAVHKEKSSEEKEKERILREEVKKVAEAERESNPPPADKPK